MAYLGAGRSRNVERIVEALRDANPAYGEVAGWSRRIGLPLVEGFAAFWRGDCAPIWRPTRARELIRIDTS